jgi:hypothetical protein
MAETDWNPDTGGRPLAEILREAGIDTSRAARRRRWDEPDEAPPVVRQRRPDAEPPADRPAFGRRRTDAEIAAASGSGATRAGTARAGALQPSPSRSGSGAGFPPVRPSEDRRAVAGPSTAAIPGIRPDRAPGVPQPAQPSAPHPSAPLPDIPLGALRGDRDTGRVTDRETGRTGVRAVRPGQRATHREEHSHTGPIPVVRATDVDDLDEDASPLAWLRFVGELVIALAAGVGVFFAATLLWEMAPYVALLLVPLAVAGLVAGVGLWRHRQGAEPVGPRLLALLVLAGTLLTIVPAAQLLAAR